MPNVLNRLALVLALLSSLLLSGCSSEGKIDPEAYNAFEAAGLIQGRHYTVIKKPLVDVPLPEGTEISVIEFFWYGCGHCAKFEAPLNRWAKTLPANVSVIKIPATWNDAMELHAKAFYIAEFLGQKQINEQLFPLIMSFRPIYEDLEQQTERLRLMFGGYYLQGEEFDERWNSEAMQAKVKQAQTWQKQADIMATPSLIIDGRYLLNNKEIGEADDVLRAAGKMVDALLMLKQVQAS